MKNTTTIPVTDRFEIRSDNIGWVLVEHVPKNPDHHLSKGGGTKEVHKFYGSVEQCCQGILSESGKEDLELARDLINEWHNAVKVIKDVFNE